GEAAGQAGWRGRAVIAHAGGGDGASADSAGVHRDIIKDLQSGIGCEIVKALVDFSLRRLELLIEQGGNASHIGRRGGGSKEIFEVEAAVAYYAIAGVRAPGSSQTSEVAVMRGRRERNVGCVAALRARDSGACLPGRGRNVGTESAPG